jgi:hypothetical protein
MEFKKKKKITASHTHSADDVCKNRPSMAQWGKDATGEPDGQLTKFALYSTDLQYSHQQRHIVVRSDKARYIQDKR